MFAAVSDQGPGPGGWGSLVFFCPGPVAPSPGSSFIHPGPGSRDLKLGIYDQGLKIIE